jgi:hypothetical protein
VAEKKWLIPRSWALVLPDMDGFERELEHELHRIIDPIVAAPIPPRRVLDSGGTMKKKLLGGAGAAIGVKVLSGFAVAAAAATMAAAATEVASTGSLNPTDWGKQVTQQVQTCKDTLRASGTRGIGQCVSAFANQHGKAVSASHKPEGAGNGNPNANANKDKTHGNSAGKHHSPKPETSPGSDS